MNMRLHFQSLASVVVTVTLLNCNIHLRNLSVCPSVHISGTWKISFLITEIVKCLSVYVY
jgi:hypothetical protein